MSIPPSVFLVMVAAVASPLVFLLDNGWIDPASALQRLALVAVACWVLLRLLVSWALPSPNELRHNAATIGAAAVQDTSSEAGPATTTTAPTTAPGTA